MKTKLIFSIALFSIFVFTQLSAGCGYRAADKRNTSKAIIEMIPSSGKIKGKTFASCGMCNFESGDRSCGVSLKIGKDVVKVVNVDIDAQIDSHAKDGFCNVVRIVNVEGKVKNNKFYADSFLIQ